MKLVILSALFLFGIAAGARATAIGNYSAPQLRADTPAAQPAQPETDTVAHSPLSLAASLGNVVLVDQTVSLSPDKGLTVKLLGTEFSFMTKPRRDQFNEKLKWWGDPPSAPVSPASENDSQR